ncbi:uncharacterized protein LOC123498989 [Portunus trituberculatus]|uniref:uncharacterized protein LOC123498989 n=1 Tax=Portunus trituberculatus TaxID=210409 RepID=UPI001E1CB85F|nr:uncharacterized protein LOC123498989 [Portunus trituberculatus]
MPSGYAQRNFRPTDLGERARLVWLWMAGRSVHNISVITGTSVTTVYRWIRRWQREGHVNSRPRSGRPRLGTSKSNTTKQIQKLFSTQSSWLTLATTHSTPPQRDPCDFHVQQTAGWSVKPLTGRRTSWREEHRIDGMPSFDFLEPIESSRSQPPHDLHQHQLLTGSGDASSLTRPWR